MLRKDDELKRQLQKVRDEEPIPEFNSVWQQARLSVAKKEHSRPESLRPWTLLIPVGAAAVLAFAIYISLAPSDNLKETKGNSPVAVAVQKTPPAQTGINPQDLPLPISWESASDAWYQGEELPLEKLNEVPTDEDDGEELILADAMDPFGDEIADMPTDFLLDTELLAWNEYEERNML